MPVFSKLFLIISLSGIATMAQVTDLANTVVDFHKRNPIEKTYLDLDKSSYVSGETIWFKLYSTAGHSHQLSPLSRVIYADLIDPEGGVVEQIKVKNDFGIGMGYFKLPVGLQTGTYLLRSYSQYMANAGDEYFFQRELNIYNVKESGESIPTAEVIPQLGLFPEGGNLVDGIPTQIAFQITDQYGKPLNEKLVIIDENGTRISEYEPLHEGVGKFPFVPSLDDEYYAILESDPEVKYQMPTIYEKGTVFNIIQKSVNEDIAFEVKTNESLQKVFLFGHARGLPVLSVNLPVENDLVIGTIPREALQPGINHFTIFRENGQPIAQRLVFNSSYRSLDVEFASSKNSYSKREQVDLNLLWNTSESDTAKAYLSMSVTDDRQVTLDTYEPTIVSELLLSSDLRGYIHNPGSYFAQDEPEVWKKQDLLMLVNGWSRFKWEDLIQNAIEYNLPIEQGIGITGRLKGDWFRQGVDNGEINYFLMQDSLMMFDNLITEANGTFAITDIDIEGEGYLVFTGNKENGAKGVVFELDTTMQWLTLNQQPVSKMERFEDRNKYMVEESFKQRQYWADLDENAIMLEEVELTAQREEKPWQLENIYGRGTYNFKIDEQITNPASYMHPLELIRARIPGVLITGGLGVGGWVGNVSMRGTSRGDSPLILLDNMPVSLATLSLVPPSMIREVEVYVGPDAVIFGPRGSDGVLAFFTRMGFQPMPSYQSEYTTFMRLEGYQEYQEFYAPDYSVYNAENARPDNRATIHWEPMIELRAGESLDLSFYTNDYPGPMTVTVEGITHDGRLFHQKWKLNE